MIAGLIIVENLPWMGWNVGLALVGLGFARVFSNASHSFVKTAMMILWLLFVPNTIYLLTDLVHLWRQWGLVGMVEKVVLLGQYGVLAGLGILTYLKSMGHLELGLYRWAREQRSQLLMMFERRMDVVLAGVNYLIAFGVIMGRFLRTNSWQVVTDPLRVLGDVVRVATSWELMTMVLGFYLLTQGIYLAYKKIN